MPPVAETAGAAVCSIPTEPTPSAPTPLSIARRGDFQLLPAADSEARCSRYDLSHPIFTFDNALTMHPAFSDHAHVEDR
jgi:hypothetical protein